MAARIRGMRVGGASAVEPVAEPKQRHADPEMQIMTKLTRLLATLEPEARMRVLGYVNARALHLPVRVVQSHGVDAAEIQPPLLQRMRADAAAEN